MDLSEIRQLYAEHPDDLTICTQIAACPHVPFKVLDSMAASENLQIQILAASHQDLAPAKLQKFAKDDNPLLRKAAARNKALGSKTAMDLTRDPDPEVRLALTAHPHLPLPAQIALSEDSVPFVRAALLDRKNLDEEIQYALCCDTDLPVHVKALLYPKLDYRWLLQWSQKGSKLSLLTIAKRKNLPEEIQDILDKKGINYNFKSNR